MSDMPPLKDLMPDIFSRRIGVSVVAFLAVIASINGATLFIQASAQSDTERRLRILEDALGAQSRKNKAVDDFIREAAKQLTKEDPPK
jgi:hypothetical protein